MYAADNDDGLKISTFEFDNSFGLWFNTAGDEIVSFGNPNGIDVYENEIVLRHFIVKTGLLPVVTKLI
jgi:hypothetical protein